jgi:cell fate (sporulation/competence/biofilm development) regulator YmcA (YheA/YmcA/DUF963 family)
MGTIKTSVKEFLSCFKQFSFNVINKEKSTENIKFNRDTESYKQSDSHLYKMLQSAKKELAAAVKLCKHGKITSEELFDYEWRVNELEQEIKDLKDFTDNESV